MPPSTSEVRRRAVMRWSNIFDDFPTVVRPVGITHLDVRRHGAFVWVAAELLEQRFPPKWPGAFTPKAAQMGLSTWCLELARLIEESSRLEDVDAELSADAEQLVARMQRWLDGEWSEDRDALERLCWRIGLSRQTISAAMWLHRFGAFAKD
jgi:hypothetical protein